MLPFELTKDTPYLALSGELWSVFYDYFNRYWSCYKGFLLYLGMNEITFCTHSTHGNSMEESEYKIASGPRLNIKTVLSMYGDFHVKDKTAVRTSYL